MGHPTEQANGARASPHRPSRSISSLPLEKLSKLNFEKRTSVSAVSSPAARVGDAAENGSIMQQSIGSLIGQDGAARRKGARRGSGDSHGSGVEGGWELERKSSSFNPFRGHRRIGSGSYLTTGKTPTPASWDSSPRAKRTGSSSRSAAASPRKLDKYAVAKIAASLFHSPGTKLERSASQRASPSSSSPGKKRNHALTVGELILPSNHRHATPRTEERVPTRPCSEQHMEESAIPPASCASSLPIHVDDTEPEEAPESPPPNASTPAEDPPPRPEQRIESPAAATAAAEIRHDESCQNPSNADVSDRADVEVFPESPTVSIATLFGDAGEGGIEGAKGEFACGELEPSDVGDHRLGLEPSDFGESGDDGGDARAMCHVETSVTREGGEQVVEDHRVRSCGVIDCVRHSACESTPCDLGDGWIGEKDGDGGEVPPMCCVAMSKTREGDCRGEEQAVGCSIGEFQVKSCGMIAHVRDNHVFQIESESIVLEDLHLFKKDDDDDSVDVSMFPTAMCSVAMEVTRESDGCEDQAVEYSIANHQDTLVATSNICIKHGKLLYMKASSAIPQDEELQDIPRSPSEVPCVRRELAIIPMVSLSSIASPSPRLALWQEDELATALSSGSCKKKSAVRPILRKRRRSASGSGLSALLLKSTRVLEEGSTVPHEKKKEGIEVGVLESEPEDAIKSTYSKFVDIEIDPRHGCVELVQHCKDISHDNTMEDIGRKRLQVASSTERQFGSNPRRLPPVKINSCTIYEGRTRTRKIKTIRRGWMNSYDLDTLKEYLETTNSFPSLPKADSSTNKEEAAAATAISPHNKLMDSSLSTRERSRTFVSRLQAPSSGAFSYVDIYRPCSVSILSNPSFSSSHQDKLWEEQAEIYSSGGRGTPGRDDDDNKNDNDDEARQGDATAQPSPPPPSLVFNLHHHSPLPGFGSALHHHQHHHHEHQRRQRHQGPNPLSRPSGLRNGSLRSPPESGHFMHQIMSRIRGSSPKAAAVTATAGTTPARPGSYVTSRMEISKKRNPWSSCICFSVKT